MYIKATVKAGSGKDSVSEKNGRYIVSVREKAVEGRANDAARAALAQHLNISEKDLALVRGAKKPSKLFMLRKGK
jgi:uncharacterized protein YggU (UPF0235/DUF167 family)